MNLFEILAARFILWSINRTKSRHKVSASYWCRRRVVTFAGAKLFIRFEPFRNDEWITSDGQHNYRPPWYLPFNALLHCWDAAPGTESFHDHPRWSITICLRGRITEKTPWVTRELRPGSIVIRSRKAIHAFELPCGYRGKTWTLFIVGRRNHRQNTYVVTPQGVGTAHAKD